MSPKAAEARLARTISSGDLFAPKGGFSCPAFNSLQTLDFDLPDPNLTKTSSVLVFDGLELSPLASSYQFPLLGTAARSPLAPTGKTAASGPRGCSMDGTQHLPRQSRPGESDRHRQMQHQHSAAEKSTDSDYTTPTTEPSSQNQSQQPEGCVDRKETCSSKDRTADDSEENIWDRAFSAGRRLLESAKRSRSVAVPQLTVTTTPAQETKPQKKRRVVKKDPNKPKPKPWSESELAQFRRLVKSEGASNWKGKAEKLGTNRSAKSLHTRWLREEGRIVDRPRGIAAMRQHEAQQASSDN